jgi:hypothetical protein
MNKFNPFEELEKDPEFQALPPDEQVEYLRTLRQDPEARVRGFLREAERTLAEDDIESAMQFTDLAEKTYNNAGLDNREILEFIDKLKRNIESQKDRIKKITEETREKTDEVL